MIEAHFVERGSFTVVGAASTGQLGQFNYAEIWEKQYMPLDALLKPHSVDGGCYGVTLSEGDHLIYLAGVAAANLPELPKGAVQRQIPGANFAVFDCVFSTMAATVQEIYGQWFYTSDKELDTGAVPFEYYLSSSGEDEMRVQLYIPVKSKTPAPIQQESTLNILFEAIANRRSIRKFKPDPIPEETLRQILLAGILAPSGKNRQPWKFYVVQGEKYAEMITQMHAGFARNEAEGKDIGSAKNTLRVMEQAPVTVFIFNPYGTPPWMKHSIDQTISDVVDIQSIGAAIQNMLLAAEELGLGSLWMCDVFLAYEELSAWLGESSQMIAGISFGVADEHPIARKRKPFDEVVHWV
jgi:nitroreductase/predicted transcriptional regulator YdeE